MYLNLYCKSKGKQQVKRNDFISAVSGVVYMTSMFYHSTPFNQPLSTWDGKCWCCLLIAHDESKLFHCRLTYVCRLLCVGCIIESSPLLRSRRPPPPPPPQCRVPSVLQNSSNFSVTLCNVFLVFSYIFLIVFSSFLK